MTGTGFGEASGCPQTCSKGDPLVFSKPLPFFTLCVSAHDDGNIVAATATVTYSVSTYFKILTPFISFLMRQLRYKNRVRGSLSVWWWATELNWIQTQLHMTVQYSEKFRSLAQCESVRLMALG